MITTEKKTVHYVNNALLLESLVKWLKEIKKAKRNKTEKPPIPDYIAECMMKMANRLSQKAGFVNYSYRDEMIADSLESCCRYLHNFDPTKSSNPFAYITQIIHNAFIRRIQKEQKQLYVKMRIVDDADFTDSYERQEGDNHNYNNSYVTYLQENKGEVIAKFENWKQSKKTKAAKKKEAKLANLFEEEATVQIPVKIRKAKTIKSVIKVGSIEAVKLIKKPTTRKKKVKDEEESKATPKLQRPNRRPKDSSSVGTAVR